MSGEGCLASRPHGAPGAHATPEVRPFLVGKLGADGEWRVLLLVPVPGAAMVERELTVEQADALGCELIEYVCLLRERRGLPGGKAFPDCATALLHEGEA